MVKKILFPILVCILLISFDSKAQVELYPLSQYSVGQQYHHSRSNLRVTSSPQSDTLTIPFIEDFSGAMIPIKKVTIDTVKIVYDSTGRNTANTADSIYKINRIGTTYQIIHLKRHGLDASHSNPIFIFNVAFPYANNAEKADTAKVYGKRYAKVIDKYTIEIFNDTLCHSEVPVFNKSRRMFFCNWLRSIPPRYSTYPDTLAFVDNDGGVFINDDMAPNARSVGVASFDGVNYKGIPYATTAVSGYADNLTSLPFYLKPFKKDSAVGLSFYWQCNSLGDSPLSKEYLAVEFKDTLNNWNQVLQIFGNPSDPLDTFRLAYIPLDSMYLYNGFQYRIRNYGILNGRFNVWNVDYIYLNTKMNTANATVKDISYSSINKNSLKNYTSIPYLHFKNLANPADQLKTNATFVVNYDLPSASLPFAITYQMATSDNILVNNAIDVIKTSSFTDPPVANPSRYSRSLPSAFKLEKMTEPYILRQNFSFTNLDTIYPIDMSFNNYRKNETVFYDYYAYDDGTPEISMKLQQTGGVRLAHEYTILQADTLTHLDFGFLKNNGLDLTNFTVYMTVWQMDLSGKLSEIVPNGQAIAVKYSTDINGFVRYEFSPHIALNAGTYYFGLRQQFSSPLFIGYDRNNNQLDKIFTCIDGENWIAFSTTALHTGALMIRPVFYKKEDPRIVTSIKKYDLTENENHFSIYPNPTQGLVNFTGNPDYVILYDIGGKILLQSVLEPDSSSIQIDNLPNGIYVLALKKNDYTEIKRVIIQK